MRTDGEAHGAMTAAFVHDTVRTPFGRLGGGLAGVRPHA
jgi:hypothetical protein